MLKFWNGTFVAEAETLYFMISIISFLAAKGAAQ